MIYRIASFSGHIMAVPAIIGLARFKNIAPAYQPFIYVTWLAFAQAMLGHILSPAGPAKAIADNGYGLLESLLFCWLFYNWGALKEKAWHLPALATGLLLAWTADNFILHHIGSVNSLFGIVYSFVLVFLAINQLNIMIMDEAGSLLRHAQFLICTGICILYSYKAFLAAFYCIRLDKNIPLLNNVFLILAFVNLFVTFIYALAALWIPTRQNFTRPS